MQKSQRLIQVSPNPSVKGKRSNVGSMMSAMGANMAGKTNNKQLDKAIKALRKEFEKTLK